MPAMLADSAATTAIGTELTAQGVDASLHATLLLAVARAGFDVEPTGGGTPVSVASFLASEMRPVAGVPGLFVAVATLPDATVVYRMVTAEEVAKGRRAPSVEPPSLSLAAATPAALRAITSELDVLRIPADLLTPLITAIDDAGYQLSARAGGAVATGSALAADLRGIEGFPGMVSISVTLPDASVLTRVQNDAEVIGERGMAGLVGGGGGGGTVLDLDGGDSTTTGYTRDVEGGDSTTVYHPLFDFDDGGA